MVLANLVIARILPVSSDEQNIGNTFRRDEYMRRAEICNVLVLWLVREFYVTHYTSH